METQQFPWQPWLIDVKYSLCGQSFFTPQSLDRHELECGHCQQVMRRERPGYFAS